jgi:two-component system, chemotaxis family, sensor kinase CheA
MSKQDKEAGKRDFISEAEEIVEQLTTDIHQLESSLKTNNVKPELINKIFREFHSLKGISGMLGFDKISSFTHELENMLDRLRLGKIELTAAAVDVLYQALDVLNHLIGEIHDDSGEKTDPSGVIRKINETMAHEVTAPQTSAFPELALDEQTIRSFTEYEEYRLRENVKHGTNIYSIRLIFDNATFDQDLREITELLGNRGEIISTLPSFDTSVGLDKMVFRLIMGTSEKEQALAKHIEREDVLITNLRIADSRFEAAEDEPEVEKVIDASLKSFSHTVRVDIQKLDEVMNLIGELIITKAMITNIGKELVSTTGSSRTGTTLSRVALDLEKKLNELQRDVIEIRLVPIGQIYNKLSRMIRKLSRENNKQIDLQFSGEDTKLDKIMIEQLSDPLIHIIRNSIDHGIESAEDRRRLGKPQTGLIRLASFQRGNNVVIQVQDDGRGIQLAKVQNQARKRGLIPKDHIIDIKECIDLIFTPGFSSQEQVTEISGRGVGLDVVKKNIADLKGSLNVFTEEGKGTTFELTLPITLAIMQALIVKVCSNKYAIPLGSVAETVRVWSRDLQTVDRKEVYYLRNKTLPLIRIGEVFHLADSNHREKVFIVVVRTGEQQVGLIVDELAGQQEIVIKSMGERLKDIRGIAGATEIGEKKPILVLDPESIIEEVTQSKIRSV